MLLTTSYKITNKQKTRSEICHFNRITALGVYACMCHYITGCVCSFFFFNELSKNYRALVWKNTEQDNRKYNVSKQLVL